MHGFPQYTDSWSLPRASRGEGAHLRSRTRRTHPTEVYAERNRDQAVEIGLWAHAFTALWTAGNTAILAANSQPVELYDSAIS